MAILIFYIYINSDKTILIHLWQSFTSVPLTKTRIFKSGNKINIKKARLGGFWLRDDKTGIQIKVKRIK